MSQILTLVGKTQKGKNRIRELGNKWRIILDWNSVTCLRGAPGFLIAPVTNDTDKVRWIAKQHDIDFDIV